MPTYEYECRSCHHQFELFQVITAKPVTRCPQCHKEQVRRLIGRGAGVIFKGTGFYQTDYRSESYRKQSAAEKPATAGKPSAEAGKPTTTGKPTTAGKPAPKEGAAPAVSAAASATGGSAQGGKPKKANTP